jgi:protein arginine N-methyltransferase 1
MKSEPWQCRNFDYALNIAATQCWNIEHTICNLQSTICNLQLPWEKIVVSLILDEHRHYLADQARNAAFRQAIEETVRPGDVVLDLGCGSGVLGLLACQAGAGKVYAIDSGGVIELARKLCEANGFADRVVYIKGMSTLVELPERADVVVADQIGFGSEFGLFSYFDDARERLLKPGGALIPSRVDLYVAPVECPQVYDAVDFWSHDQAGFDVRPAHAAAVNACYRLRLSPDQLLGAPAMGASVSLLSPTPGALTMKTSFVVGRAGTLHGIGGWFGARLSHSARISNSPLADDAIDREQVFFAIERPVDVAEGDRVELAMHILTADHIVTWSVEVLGESGGPGGQIRPGSKGAFSHSTWKGMLVAREDLHRTRPDFVPTLKPRAAAWKSALELCDGRRSVAEIERDLYRRHPDLFRSPAEAAALVAEAIGSYAV